MFTVTSWIPSTERAAFSTQPGISPATAHATTGLLRFAILHDASDGVTVVGIDEETALVGGPDRWEVQGRSTVTVLGPGGGRHVHHPGDEVDLP